MSTSPRRQAESRTMRSCQRCLRVGARPEEGAGIRWTHGYTVHDNAPTTTFCPRPACFSPPARVLLTNYLRHRAQTPPSLPLAKLVRGLFDLSDFSNEFPATFRSTKIAKSKNVFSRFLNSFHTSTAKSIPSMLVKYLCLRSRYND